MTKFYKFIYNVFARPVRWMWKVTSEGKENIPDEGCIIICNHTSFADVLVLEVAQERQVFFMGKKELFKIPGLKQLISGLGAFPVNRGGADVGSIKRTISEIQSGRMVGIFPQGTRLPKVDPRTTEVKGGVAMIAVRAGCKIVPAFIDNAGGKTRPFSKNHVIFGKPITAEELEASVENRRDYQGMMEYAFSKVCELKYGEGNGDMIKPATEEASEADNG